MASNSFLSDICDYHLNYANCGDLNLWFITDMIVLGICVMLLLIYSYYLTRKLINSNLSFAGDDALVIVSCFYPILRIGQLFNLHRQVGQNFGIRQQVSTTIGLEMMIWICVGVQGNESVKRMVKAAVGSDLYQPITVNGRTINPAKALSLYRIFVLLTNITLYTLFMVKGVNETYQEYMLYRRLCFIWLSVLSLAVSPSVLLYFSSQIFLKFDQMTLSMDRKKNLAVLKRRIILVIAMYWASSLYATSCWLTNELISDHFTLLIIKSISDVFVTLLMIAFCVNVVFNSPAVKPTLITSTSRG
ncbi:hypothetical protein BC833DRAFT_576484, partial [Globomyces pollinis-pini]